MLDEYKNSYKETANQIPNWLNIDKNDLCNLYLDNEGTDIQQAYLSAIIYKYWSLIPKYHSLSYNVASPEDVYEWLVDAIMYALEHKSWKNPKSSIYNDPCGPDKVINRCMKCRRLTYYQAINRKKRQGGAIQLSLDEISEETTDCNTYLEDLMTDCEIDNMILNQYILKIFDKKLYFMELIA